MVNSLVAVGGEAALLVLPTATAVAWLVAPRPRDLAHWRVVMVMVMVVVVVVAVWTMHVRRFGVVRVAVRMAVVVVVVAVGAMNVGRRRQRGRLGAGFLGQETVELLGWGRRGVLVGGGHVRLLGRRSMVA